MTYKKLQKDNGVYLILYCMRRSRAQIALLRDYENSADIVSSAIGSDSVPVAAVATYLEDYLEDMDDWWAKIKLHRSRIILWMPFSSHACATSLPDKPNVSSTMRTL
jgi:hypothetical protein